MQLKEHVLYGAAASTVLTPFFGAQSAFFFIGSVLIDADHYLDFLYFGGFRNWSVKAMFRFHGILASWRDRPNHCALETFHTLEFILALLGIGLYFKSSILLLTFSGMIFHLCLDLIRLRQWGKVRLRALSFVEYVIRIRKMKAMGIDPEQVAREAYALCVVSRESAAPALNTELNSPAID